MKKMNDHVRVTIRVPKSLYEKMTEYAEDEFMTVNEYAIKSIVMETKFKENMTEFMVGSLQNWLLTDQGKVWSKNYIRDVTCEMLQDHVRLELVNIIKGVQRMAQIEEMLGGGGPGPKK